MSVLLILDNKIVDALKAYEPSTPIEGYNNAFDILEAFGGIKIKGKPSGSIKSACQAKNQIEKSLDSISIKMKSEAYLSLVDSIFTDFATDANAQYILPIFAPSWILDFSAFNLIGGFYSTSVKGGSIPSLQVKADFSDMFTSLKGGGLDGFGFYGDGVAGLAMTRNSANAVKGVVSTVLNSKSFVFDVIDGDSNVIESAKSASVSAGVLAFDFTPAAGAYTNGIIQVSKMVYKTKSHAALLMDFDLAKYDSIVYAMGFEA